MSSTANGFSRRTGIDRQATAQELIAIVDRARAGEQDAIRELYLRYADHVYGYARSIVKDEHDAEDVTQQVFTRLMTAIGRYRHGSAPFTAWLLRVTHNLAIDHIRGRVVALDESLLPDRSGDAQPRRLARDLQDALAELPLDQREVLVLRHVAGYSPGEIASMLDRSEDSVHGLHHRGRRKLRTELERRDAHPVTLAA